MVASMNNPARLFSLTVVFSIVLLSGCRKSAAPTASSQPTPTAPVAAPSLEPAGGSAIAPQTKFFQGSIGTTLDLQMKLVRTGEQLNGSYFYRKVGSKIDLRGRIDSEGNVTLDEFDSGGKQTGLFKGIWRVKPEDGLIAIAGNWSKPPGEKGSEKKIAFSLHEEPISFTGNVELVNKPIKESNKKLKYEVDVQYPQITGGNNPNFEKFNEAARGLVTKKVADFKREMSEPSGVDPETAQESSGSDITISYNVALAQDDLVSIKFDVGSYFTGAAHGNSYAETLNYDLKNGKPLKLSDLFKPGAKYLQTISSYAITDLKKQSKTSGGEMLDAASIESGAAPDAKNYDGWTIEKTGLGINFDPYQVGPYAAGPQFVRVPYASLKDLINPDGPLAQFIK
jgi:hypothetical protein